MADPMVELPGWDERACRWADKELFFHPEGERGTARRRRVAAAKAVCHRCPILDACRDLSLRAREQYGTWGGLSQDERAAHLAGKALQTVVARQAGPKPPPLPRLVLTIDPIPASDAGSRVSAGPACDHVRRLRDAGHKLVDIGRAAGVHASALSSLAAGERQTVSTRVARLLLATRPEAERGAA